MPGELPLDRTRRRSRSQRRRKADGVFSRYFTKMTRDLNAMHISEYVSPSQSQSTVFRGQPPMSSRTSSSYPHRCTTSTPIEPLQGAPSPSPPHARLHITLYLRRSSNLRGAPSMTSLPGPPNISLGPQRLWSPSHTVNAPTPISIRSTRFLSAPADFLTPTYCASHLNRGLARSPRQCGELLRRPLLL